MNVSKISLAGVAVVLGMAAAGGAASAQTFSNVDLNKDGAITADEYRAQGTTAGFDRSIFFFADRDGDGALNASEWRDAQRDAFVRADD
ncbi:MAG: hypothetical protein AAFR16_01885 [Pseudomonadota bacterium]